MRPAAKCCNFKKATLLLHCEREFNRSSTLTMIVPTKDLYKLAYGKYAVGATTSTTGADHGLFRGCIDSKAPFIIQISKGARSYSDKRMLEGLIRAAGDVFPDAILPSPRPRRRTDLLRLHRFGFLLQRHDRRVARNL
jgi:hypothetical protein